MQIRPLLMAFLLKISPKDPAITRGMPAYLMAVAACSRDEPVPKLYPDTRTTPGFDDEVSVLAKGARSAAAVAANSGS